VVAFVEWEKKWGASRLSPHFHWLFLGNVDYENGAIKFIERFYPVSEIVGRLKKAQEAKLEWRAEHAAAIERFWDFHKRECSSPGPPEPNEDLPS
jgi:hypothetical protein